MDITKINWTQIWYDKFNNKHLKLIIPNTQHEFLTLNKY